MLLAADCQRSEKREDIVSPKIRSEIKTATQLMKQIVVTEWRTFFVRPGHSLSKV